MDKWDSRFMQMAHVIAGWTSCFVEGRSIGCVIVKDKRIMTTGYNGAPAGLRTCHQPCSVCAKMIINAGISRVVYLLGYPDEFSLRIFEEAGILLEKFDPETAPAVN